MKKVLLATLVVAMAIPAGAQMRNQVRVPGLAPVGSFTTEVVEAQEEYAVEKTADNSYLPQARRAQGSAEAFYKRPAGSFYGCITTTAGKPGYSSYYAPMVMVHPFRDITFPDFSGNVDDASVYEWTYQIYDRALRAKNWLTSPDKDLVLNFIRESDTIPSLKVTNGTVESEYQLRGYNADAAYVSTLLAAANYETAYSNTADHTLWFSPKYRAARSNRDGSIAAGGYYTTGAGTLPDSVTSGRWYGRNSRPEWSALAVAFEKPEYNYALRQVGAAFQMLRFIDANKPVDFTVKVYRLEETPQYADESYIEVTPAELIATSTLSLDSLTCVSMFGEPGANGFSGMMTFPLTESFEGIVYEITPDIDFPIMITLSGYNDDNIADFTLTYTSDTFDEGWGEHAFLGKETEDGLPTFRGINYFFTSGMRKTGLSLYIDIEKPYFIWNYSNETGEYKFANEGETHSVDIYSMRPSEEWIVTDDQLNDLPEWLTVEFADTLDADMDYTNVTTAIFTAAPLPEGVTYRECKVKMNYPGATLYYLATQGEKGDEPDPIKGDVNGDGKVEIDDVNDLINILLGKAEATAAANVDGVGGVDVQDVNVLINIILGK